MLKNALYLSFGQYLFIRVLLAIAVLSILIFLALREYDVPMIKARLTSALSTAVLLKQEIALYYAERGTWPNIEDLQYVPLSESDASYISGFEVKNGSFKIAVDTGDKTLGIREIAFNRVEVIASKSATVLWGCGNNTYPEGVTYHRELQDNLPQRIMPSICKVK